MHPDTPHWKEALEAVLGPGTLQTNVPLAGLTTFCIGGPADLLFRARTAEALAAALKASRELEIPMFLLGGGANILVGDGGFRGLVIRCEIGGIRIQDAQGRVGTTEEGILVQAGAGVHVYPELVDATVERGLGGLHHFAGIPGTVGGAIWQNLHFLSPAPARERTVFIEEFVESAEILTEEGALETVRGGYFKFGYDYSVLHDRADTVLSVTFRLFPEPAETLRRVVAENLRWREERHPDLRRFPSAGSIFKKVEGVGAGRLIDECGLKGRVHGRAQIFERHANIIVNLGGATAVDVTSLMRLAQTVVRERTGKALEPEITLVGDF